MLSHVTLRYDSSERSVKKEDKNKYTKKKTTRKHVSKHASSNARTCYRLEREAVSWEKNVCHTASRPETLDRRLRRQSI